MDSNYSFENIKRLDIVLYQIAYYDVTKGMSIVNETENLLDLQNNIARKFNVMKSMVKRGECTVDFFKDRVYEKYGPFKNNDGEEIS